MESVEVNGKIIQVKPTKSRFTRTAIQLRDEIHRELSRIGIGPEHIDLPIPRNPLKKEMPAQISWQVNGEQFYYQCKTQERFVDNLGVISKVISMDVYAIKNGLKSFGQVMNQYRLEHKEGPAPRTPRQIIGVEETCGDLEYIKFRYRKRLKELHPDRAGDNEEIRELNRAYNELERELKG